MKKRAIATIVTLMAISCATAGYSDTRKGEKIDGKNEFKEHCAICHPDGGNIVNANKTLSKKVLAANGVKSAKDIIGKMRNPGPGMTKFDEKTISQKEAKAIAEYILHTFK